MLSCLARGSAGNPFCTCDSILPASVVLLFKDLASLCLRKKFKNICVCLSVRFNSNDSHGDSRRM